MGTERSFKVAQVLMQSATDLMWMAQVAHAHCVHQAALFYPRETGGTFMGYWTNGGTEVVVTRLIAPGPAAFHSMTAFQPDQTWQLGEIARHYRASGRRDVYLGDWHSHPGAVSGELSGVDRSVLRKIIRTPGARASSPISMVFWGGATAWQCSGWIARLIPRPLLPSRLSVKPVALQLYETVRSSQIVREVCPQSSSLTAGIDHRPEALH